MPPLLRDIALSTLDDYFDRQWRQEMRIRLAVSTVRRAYRSASKGEVICPVVISRSNMLCSMLESLR
jgi:hypothetical protein